MTKEFKQFMGMTPKKYLEIIQDANYCEKLVLLSEKQKEN